jgi:hypothetical protein
VPLKGKLLAAMQQDPNAAKDVAQLEQVIEATRDTMIESADKIRDLEPLPDAPLRGTEAAIYSLWKGVAPHAYILDEDIRRQTNAIDACHSEGDSALPRVRAEQAEALSLTQLFARRFAQAVPEQTTADEATPPPKKQQEERSEEAEAPAHIDAETRKKILELATLAESLQQQVISLIDEGKRDEARTEQETVYDILQQIKDLLPREKQKQEKQGEGEQPPSEQTSPPEGDQEKGPEDTQQEEGDPGEEPEPEPEPEPSQAEESQSELSEEDVRKLLEKALQREKEHEAEKRRRQRIPLSPHERDW